MCYHHCIWLYSWILVRYSKKMNELVFQNVLRFGCILVILMMQGISRSASFSSKDSILGAAPQGCYQSPWMWLSVLCVKLRVCVRIHSRASCISSADENYYKGLSSRGTIKCKDGSKKFNKSQLNDDFCDCADGSDEPGTLFNRPLEFAVLRQFWNNSVRGKWVLKVCI